MQTSVPKTLVGAITLLVAIVSSSWSVANAQTVTNWIAYNDHRPGPTIPPHVPVRTNWGTALRVTTYDMGAPADSSGHLTNFLNGDQLDVTVTFTRTNAVDDFPTVSAFGPATNTPAGRAFFGKVDLSNNGIVGVDQMDNEFLTITVSNLNAGKRYIFRGTSARGGGYAPRWTKATITANGWIDAHVSGPGSPGVITSNDFPANLGAGQVAWNSGDNVEGDLIGWDFIAPAPDGTFSILVEQYVGPYIGGTATSDNYGYSFGAMLLAEVESSPPVITTNPPPQTVVEQNRSFSLRVAATGTPLLYQWYKEGVGAIAGATFATYSVSPAALSTAGDYYAVVYNSLARATSTVAHVTVFADTNAPSAATVYAYPVVAPGTVNATLSQVTVEFNESVDPASATDRTHYVLSGGGGNPTSVILTNNRTVILTYASPLTEDSAYTLTISGVADIASNVAGSLATPFRTWVRGPGNGVLFEAYNTGGGVDVVALTSSPVFPDDAYLRTNLWAFDSRVVFPDDSVENFGSRLRGVFIPPVSGNWVFFLRTYDRGEIYLNPNGLNPADKMLILAEITGNEPRDWNKFVSSSFSLRGGEAYYIEALQKAGAGTNVIKVAARLADTGFPPLGGSTDLDTNSIMGAAVGAPLAPRDLGGPLTIVQDLTDLTVEANHLAIFAPLVTNPSNAPIFYQWFRNNTAIPDATGPTYSFLATNSDNGAMFRVEMAKIGSTATSRTVTLTVLEDTVSPRALEAYSHETNLALVIVEFDEVVNRGDAQDPFSYLIDDLINPTNVVLAANGMTATLFLSNPLVLDSTHQMAVSGIRDLAEHVVSPDPTILTFTAGPKLPRLSISLAGGNALISWPAPSTGFVLEQASELLTPPSSIVWSDVGVAPVVVNGRKSVAVNIAPGTRIFRLRR